MTKLTNLLRYLRLAAQLIPLWTFLLVPGPAPAVAWTTAITSSGGGVSAAQAAILARFTEASGDLLLDTNLRYADDKGPCDSDCSAGYEFDANDNRVYRKAGSSRQSNVFEALNTGATTEMRVRVMTSTAGYYGSTGANAANFPIGATASPGYHFIADGFQMTPNASPASITAGNGYVGYDGGDVEAFAGSGDIFSIQRDGGGSPLVQATSSELIQFVAGASGVSFETGEVVNFANGLTEYGDTHAAEGYWAAAPQTITVTTASVFVVLDLDTATEQDGAWTVNTTTNRLVYDGTAPGLYEAIMTASIKSAAGGTKIAEIAIFKDGVIEPQGEVHRALSGTNDEGAMAAKATFRVTGATAYIDGRAANDTDTNNLESAYYTLSVKRIGN